MYILVAIGVDSDAWALLEISLSWKEAGTGGREVT
jgi:hypothetical protein